MKCRVCDNRLDSPVIDLGLAPHSNELYAINSGKNAAKYPLRLFFCNQCFLLQTDDQIPASRKFLQMITRIFQVYQKLGSNTLRTP